MVTEIRTIVVEEWWNDRKGKSGDFLHIDCSVGYVGVSIRQTHVIIHWNLCISLHRHFTSKKETALNSSLEIY